MSSHNKAVIATSSPALDVNAPHFNPDGFEALIGDKGYAAALERALRCPCTANVAGAGMSSCLNCGGTGWFFIDRVETVIKATSLSFLSKNQPWSEVNMGTINVTATPQDRLAFMDKITLLELESIHQKTFVVRTNNAANKRFIFTTYAPLQVLDLYMFTNDTDPLTYIDPSLYTVSNHKVEFAAVDTVPADARLTIRYTHNPVYHVLDVNRDMHKVFTGRDCKTLDPVKKGLPISAVARRAHFITDAPQYSGSGLNDNTNYTRTPISYE